MNTASAVSIEFQLQQRSVLRYLKAVAKSRRLPRAVRREFIASATHLAHAYFMAWCGTDRQLASRMQAVEAAKQAVIDLSGTDR